MKQALSLLLLTAMAATSCKSTRTSQIQLENTSPLSLTDKAIVIARSSLKNVPEGYKFPVVLSATNDTVPSQVNDMDSDGQWDELVFVTNLPANSKNTYALSWADESPVYTTRTSVRFGKRESATAPVKPALSETLNRQDMPKAQGFQKYQTDGPSWENDKVGFRQYFDGRNAKDLFGKLTPGITPENVGINAQGAVEDNYHVMAAWGRDPLAVGNSNGIGGVGLLSDTNVIRLGVTVDDSINNIEKTDFSIIAEGPVKSAFRIKYQKWYNWNLEETVSITPGMYAYHNSVKISNTDGGEKLLIGIVNINAVNPPQEIKISDRLTALVSHERHGYNKEWIIGLALLLPTDRYEGYIKAPQGNKLTSCYLAKMKITGQPLDYYAVAGWELSDKGFADSAYFRQYVINLGKQIDAEVKVTVLD
ncbi:DUF4861 family protein [uncultured Chitinophaga sp.]|uniref:DUF4861 family protein n=1 Tax=uncultured Chitinophaga sp. TaxID=339340 RepID=UPI0025F41646|nr:DUF4861 family protein [uncultured Chitinophaga sp.]